jgi:hypothetical protein
MGPYCKFCNRRCFTAIALSDGKGNIIGGALRDVPPEKAKEILGMYDEGITIIATCAGGQQFEREKVGICYSDIRKLAIPEKEATS